MGVFNLIFLFNKIPCRQDYIFPHNPPSFRLFYKLHHLYHPSLWVGQLLLPSNVDNPTFKIFQNASCIPGIWSASVNTHSTLQKILSDSIFISFQELSGHHILAWNIHLLPSSQITLIVNPNALVTRYQKGKSLQHIKQFHHIITSVQFLLFTNFFLPYRDTIQTTSSGV